MKNGTLCLIFLLTSLQVFCQTRLDAIRVQEVTEGQHLADFLQQVEQHHPIRFYYLDDWISMFRMGSELEGLSLHDAISSLTNGSEIGFVFLFDYAVVFYKDPTQELQRTSLLRKAVSAKVRVDEVMIGTADEYEAGKKVIVRGTVKDEQTGGPLAGAVVYINGLDFGTTADASGKYEIALPSGQYLISFRFVNYDERIINLSAYQDGQLDIVLHEEPVTLEEVVITDQAMVNRRVGHVTIDTDDIKRLPSFLGEVDIIKHIQLQTGVTTVSEASSGFNVRGGGVDQNLIQYDGVPIFNTSHALGFFTAFNSDAVREASFYKGGIPAEFGGRVSSVLDLTAKEGDYSQWHAKGGIGLVSSNLSAGGPVKRDTSAVNISLRSTYSDWMLNLLQTKYREISDGSVFFYDASIKYSQKIDKNRKLTVSAYTSSDQFQLANDTTNQWRNIALSFRYDNILRHNLFYSAGLYLGRYSYKVSEEDPATAFDLRYSITYPALKIDFNRDGGLHKQSFGVHATYYHFNPGDLKSASASSDVNDVRMATERALETALYVSDNFNLGERVRVEAGLRLSMYTQWGPGTVYRYEQGQPREPQHIISSREYGAGEIMKNYIGPEPRLSARYTIGPNSSLKLGYNRIYQYVHLITNSAAVTPVDIWQSSNTYFKPQVADQASLGYFRNSRSRSLEFSLEGFYKYQKNILDFKDGATLILNPQLETALLSGIGEAYGLEVTLNKITGRVTGGLNYTYSRSLRKVTQAYGAETINEGSWYPSNFDQPRIANLSWKMGITRRIFLSGNISYHTGRPISLPVSSYIINGVVVSDFNERNNYRIPDYHRADLSLVIEGSNKANKKWISSWAISVYNIYGRRNPYSVFFLNKGAGMLGAYQLSLIGSPVPSISYNFKL